MGQRASTMVGALLLAKTQATVNKPAHTTFCEIKEEIMTMEGNL